MDTVNHMPVSVSEGGTEMSIKECPFCGSTDNRIHNHVVTNKWKIVGLEWFVQCLGCRVEGPSEDSREFAVKAWNKGTPRHHEVHRLRAALEQIRDGDWKYTFATPSRDYWMQEIAREALE